MNGMPDGTENKIETHNQTTKASSRGPTIINDNYNSQQNIKNNTVCIEKKKNHTVFNRILFFFLRLKRPSSECLEVSDITLMLF